MNDSEGLLKGGKKKRNVCESLRASKQAVLRHRERVPVRRTDAYAQASGSRCAVHRPAYWAGDPSQDRDTSGSCWLPSPRRRAVTGDGGNPSKLVFDPPEVVGDIKGTTGTGRWRRREQRRPCRWGPSALGRLRLWLIRGALRTGPERPPGSAEDTRNTPEKALTHCRPRSTLHAAPWCRPSG